MDLVIEIDLTERVLTRPREGTPGALNLVHVAEPPSVLLHTPAWPRAAATRPGCQRRRPTRALVLLARR